MKTTFSLIATFQIHENYAFNEDNSPDTANPHWKPKGGEEVVVREGISLEEASGPNLDQWVKQAQESQPESNAMFQFSALNWELVALGSKLIEDVRRLLVSSDAEWYHDSCAYIDVAYELEITDYAAKWAIDQLSNEANGE